MERGLIAEKISGVNLCGRQGPTTTDRTWALRVGPFSSQKNHPESGVVCRYFEIFIVTIVHNFCWLIRTSFSKRAMFDQRFKRRNIIAHAALDDMNLQNAKTQEWLAFAAQLVHMVPAQRGSREASQTMRADDAAKQKI